MSRVSAFVLALALLVPMTAAADRGNRHHHRRQQQLFTPIAAVPSSSTAGAIAYSPSTGQIGWSYGQPDQETARWAAQQACGVADCAWQVSEHDEVAVLVLSNAGPYVGWDTNLADAQARALQACSANTTGCYVARWVSR